MAKAKTVKKKVAAKKAPAKKVVAKAAPKGKKAKTAAKYAQPGAPWWKQVPLPEGK